MDNRTPAGRLPMALLWLGVVATLAGLCLHPSTMKWPAGRMAEMIVIAGIFCLAAWPCARALRWPFAACLGLAGVVATVAFSGLLPSLATAGFACAAIAIGAWVLPEENPALQGLLGAGLLSALIGWTLPLPIHHAWVYVAACLLPIVLNRVALRRALSAGRTQLSGVAHVAPLAASFSVLMLVLASTAGWLPTMQYDDLAYHLGLPWQLQDNARYALDPSHQVWALNAWAGDVVQAIPQVISHAEARGPINLLWLLACATGIWRIMALLGQPIAGRWLAILLFASIPLTTSLMGGMQSELPTAATLTWLVALALGPRDGRPRMWLAMTLLAALLMSLKLLAGLMAVPVLLVALFRHPWPAPLQIVGLLVLGLILAGSSYTYSYAVSGNPVLPLFNQVFHSPYFGDAAFKDSRWLAGFDLQLPWDMTFHTSRYHEGFSGGGGFLLVALAGAWLLGFWFRSTRLLAALASVILLLPLSQLQYLRYAYPGLVLLCPLLVAVASRVDTRHGIKLVAGVCLLNFAFQANSDWMLRTGAIKALVLRAGNEERLLEKYAPERLVARAMRAQGGPAGNVLLLQPERPFCAEFSNHGRCLAWYSPALQHAAEQARSDPSGHAWARLLQRQRISDVVLVPVQLQPGPSAALEAAGAKPVLDVGDLRWLHLAGRNGMAAP